MIRLSKTLDPFRMGGASSFTVVIQAPTTQQAVNFIKQLSCRIKEDKEHFQDVIVLAAIIILPAILTLMISDKATSGEGYLKDWADVVRERG